jgi:hypothetical protein
MRTRLLLCLLLVVSAAACSSDSSTPTEPFSAAPVSLDSLDRCGQHGSGTGC